MKIKQEIVLPNCDELNWADGYPPVFDNWGVVWRVEVHVVGWHWLFDDRGVLAEEQAEHADSEDHDWEVAVCVSVGDKGWE